MRLPDNTLISSHLIRTKTRITVEQYNYYLRDTIYNLLDDYLYDNKDLILITESNYMSNLNVSIGLMLSYNRGGAVHLLNPYMASEIKPSAWRKRIGLKGNLAREKAKAEALKYVQQIDEYKYLKKDDEAEAITIMLALGVNPSRFKHIDIKKGYAPK